MVLAKTEPTYGTAVSGPASFGLVAIDASLGLDGGGSGVLVVGVVSAGSAGDDVSSVESSECAHAASAAMDQAAIPTTQISGLIPFLLLRFPRTVVPRPRESGAVRTRSFRSF